MEKLTLSIAEYNNGKKEVNYVIVSYDYMAIKEYKKRLSELPECVITNNIYKFPLVTYTIEEREYDVEAFNAEMTNFVLKYYDRSKDVLEVGVGQYYASYSWSKSGEAIVYVRVNRPFDSKSFGDTGGTLMCLLCNKNTKTFRPCDVDGATRSKRNALMIDDL